MRNETENEIKNKIENKIKKCKAGFEIRKTLISIGLIMCIMSVITGCGNNSRDKGAEPANSPQQNISEKDSQREQYTKETLTVAAEQSEEGITTVEAELSTEEIATTTTKPPTEEIITAAEPPTEENTKTPTESPSNESESSDSYTSANENNESTTPAPTHDKNSRIVAIDAGHQSRGNSEKEPVGPGASEMKAKVAGGTRGISTGKPEYELTLEISIKLKQELESRGYTVVMIRETNDVNISNAERAQIANLSGATAFLRIHADGSEDSSVSGATTLCPTSQNPYCADIYADSRRLSDFVLEALCGSTGCKKRYVSEVDNMSGINWCQIPVSIVEVGFMTNANEDMLLSTEEYQWKAARGIADGVDRFYGE